MAESGTLQARRDPPAVVGGEMDDSWLVERLSVARAKAQALADEAYSNWSADPTRERHELYRVAQDRADTMLSDLVDLVRALEPIA